MKKTRIYVAITSQGAYVVFAYNKSQIENAGMNMKLDWRSYTNLGKAKRYCDDECAKVVAQYDVTKFKSH